MAGKALHGVLQRIRTLAAVHTDRGCSDRELLARFLRAEDEAAFTVLVERHGPMVAGLCRRLLRDRHEADDACQATFLVLARKARSVRKQASLASWLHGVAYRIALSLRRQRARRVRREQAVSRPAVQEMDSDVSWREFRAVLDEELQRMPERYRAPLILCYLEGKTRDEAAQQLGAKIGALHGWLNRGRRLLRARLTQRGLTLSAVLFATALTEAAARAMWAPSVVVASARAALALLRGQAVSEGLIGPQVLSLAQEASQVMFMTKLKIGAALVVAASIMTGIVGGSLSAVGHAQDVAAAQTKAPPAAAVQKTESDEEFIRRMSKDLRGVEPTSTEVHFFVANKDANRRQKLIDLFIQERQAKAKADPKHEENRAQLLRRLSLDLTGLPPTVSEMQAFIADKSPDANDRLVRRLLGAHGAAACQSCHNSATHSHTHQGLHDLARIVAGEWHAPAQALRLKTTQRRLAVLQGEFLKELNATAKEKKEVAAITLKYLDQLQEYVKAHPQNDDVAEAMQQIAMIYRSQGKTVEADAWRDKLLKEYPQSPAAKELQKTGSATTPSWKDFFEVYPAPQIQRIWPAQQQPYTTQPYPALTQPYPYVKQPHPTLTQPYPIQNFYQLAPKDKKQEEPKK